MKMNKSENTYQEAYFNKEFSHMDVTDTPFVNLIVNEAIKRGKLKREYRILEIGSGSGRFTIPLLKNGYNVICSEAHPKWLIKLQNNIEKNGFNTKVMHLDINSKDSAHSLGKFDIICGFHVLHHIPNLKFGFLKMASLLNRNGKIVFVEPNPLNILYYLQMLVVKNISWNDEKGILNMRNNYLRKIIKSSNFKEVSISKFGFFPDFIVNKFTWLEQQFNKTTRNPIGLYNLIVASKN